MSRANYFLLSQRSLNLTSNHQVFLFDLVATFHILILLH